MTVRFHAPPNWPSMPNGWQPSSGWTPDPAWGPAPFRWEFWREEDDPDLSHRGSAYYPLFALAFGICFVLGLALAKIGSVFEVDALAVLGYAPMALTAKLHRRFVALSTHRSKDETALAAGFGKPWPIVLVVGSIIYFLATQVAGFVVGLVVSPQQVGVEIWMSMLTAGIILAGMATLPLLGFSSGLRADRGAYLLPPLMGLFGSLLGLITTMIALATGGPTFEVLRAAIIVDFSTAATSLIFGLISGALLGIPFVYVGRRHRKSQYAAWVVRRKDRIKH